MRDGVGPWRLDATRGARFVNPGRPISPDTMAIHHILDEWVQDAGYWKAVAPPILRPETGVIALSDDADALSKNEQVQKAYLGIA